MYARSSYPLVAGGRHTHTHTQCRTNSYITTQLIIIIIKKINIVKCRFNSFYLVVTGKYDRFYGKKKIQKLVSKFYSHWFSCNFMFRESFYIYIYLYIYALFALNGQYFKIEPGCGQREHDREMIWDREREGERQTDRDRHTATKRLIESRTHKNNPLHIIILQVYTHKNGQIPWPWPYNSAIIPKKKVDILFKIICKASKCASAL